MPPRLVARLLDRGVQALRHYGDQPSCAEVRESIFTGFQQSSHQVDIGGASAKQNYYRFCAQGRKVDTSWWAGPWECDVETARQVGDDPAQSSGSLVNWLRRAGITTGLVGKYQNWYAAAVAITINGVTTDYRSLDAAGFPLAVRRVPPDWDYWNAKSGDENCAPFGGVNGWGGDTLDSYHLWMTRKDETDQSNIGPFVESDDKAHDYAPAVGVPEYTSYDHPVVNASSTAVWDGGTSPMVTVTIRVDDDANGQGHQSEVGDEICLNGFTGAWAPLNVAPALGAPGTNQVITQIVDAHTFRFRFTATSPSAAHSIAAGAAAGTALAYTSKHYSTNLIRDGALEFMDRRADDEPWYLYIGFDACHQGQSDSVEVEQIDVDTIDAADFAMLGGVPGAFEPTVDTGDVHFTAAKDQWKQRIESLASLWRAVLALCDYIDTRNWGESTVIIFTSDQGVHYGEHGMYVNGNSQYFVKNTAWEPSTRSPFVMAHPHVPAQTLPVISGHIDEPLTVLDLFAAQFPDLADHAAHDNRDGYSIMRIIGGLVPDEYPDRAIAIQHSLQSGAKSDAVADAAGYKFIGATGDSTVVDSYDDQLYDLDADTYEATNLLHPVSQATWIGGVYTYSTRKPHPWHPGDTIEIRGLIGGDGTVNGNITIASTPSATTFTAAHATDPGGPLFGGTGLEFFASGPSGTRATTHAHNARADAMAARAATLLSSRAEAFRTA